MRYSISPGSYSAPPQVLLLSGTPPDSALNSKVIINVSVTDSFATTYLPLELIVPPNVAPIQIKNFTKFTWYPGDSYTEKITINDYFFDTDALTVTTSASSYVTNYLKTSVDSNNAVLGPILNINFLIPDSTFGTSSDSLQESDETITITVTDPFGNSTSADINVEIRLTAWQKIRVVVIILLACASAALSVLGYVMLYPIVFNFFKTSRVTVPNPLNAQHPVFTLPDGAKNVKIQTRVNEGFLQPVRNCVHSFSEYLYDEMTLRDFTLWDPPLWMERGDFELELQPHFLPGSTTEIDPETRWHETIVRVYDRREILMMKFVVNYEESF